ncbi:MAG: hypothetical protein LBG46_01065 [Elusimicrobiota bacterium]|jgi:hypothetical protein|nr:hypothetical protein [Elusimicrobiota bacterium]
MKKIKKTTKADIFLKSFERWQKILGLTDWKMVWCKYARRMSTYAQIKYSASTRAFYLYHNLRGCQNPAAVGLHEALHLLLADAQIKSEKEEHRIIYRLENLLAEAEKQGY